MRSGHHLVQVSALAGVVYAVFSMVLSDMHTAVDIVVYGTGSFRATAGFLEFSGYFVGPLLTVSLVLFSLGFFTLWRKVRKAALLVTGCLLVLSAVLQALVGFADIGYAQAIGDYGEGRQAMIALAGSYRGLATLVVALVQGLIFPVVLCAVFSRQPQKGGTLGAVIIILSVVCGVVAKMLSATLFFPVLIALFLAFMGLKSLGIIMVAKACLDYSISTPASGNS